MTDSTDVLLKAADLLGEKGWTQGRDRNDQGGMCARGAIRRAYKELTGRWAGDLDTTGPVRQALDRLFRDLNGGKTFEELARTGDYVSIPMWNDEPYRSAEDVILRLKKAANND